MTIWSSPMGPAYVPGPTGTRTRYFPPRLFSRPVRVFTSELIVSSMTGDPVFSGPTTVVVVEAMGGAVVVVVAPGRGRTVVVVVAVVTTVVAGPPVGRGNEPGVPDGGPAANSAGPRRNAASTRSSNGTRSTPWSRATSPQAAPASRKAKTDAQRSAKLPRLPSMVMAAPTSVSPGAREALTSGAVNAGSAASCGNRSRKYCTERPSLAGTWAVKPSLRAVSRMDSSMASVR